MNTTTSRPMVIGMKGKIASRAHSFKENLLEALGHHTHDKAAPAAHVVLDQGPPQRVHSAGHSGGSSSSSRGGQPVNKSAIQLAKKTNSTDNLIGYSEPKHNTDSLARDVQLALSYFQDAVTKGTLELLPGCASIVLERVVGLQSFVFHDPDLKDDPSLTGALGELYTTISNLTQWADAVIVSGSLEQTEESSETVVDPVRKAVAHLINQIHCPAHGSGSKPLKKPNQLHNSLPDISSPDVEHYPNRPSPPRLPKRKREDRHRRHHSRKIRNGDELTSPPPLPPKHGKHHRDSLNLGSADWFSNPLFDPQVQQSMLNNKSSKFSYDPNIDLPSPHGLDTTLPDGHGFPYIDEVSSPLNLSRDSCFGDEITTTETLPSSPSFGSNELSLRDEGHNSLSSILPPPVPPPNLPKKEYKRKKSHHDPSSSSSLSAQAPAHGQLSSSHSFDLCSRKKVEPVFPGAVNVHPAGFMIRSERRSSDGMNGAPPPLPPKKRDILNYMELLGQSLLPSREDLMQSLAQTQMLLQNVWAENYHEFGEFVPDNSAFNFPPAQGLFTQNIDLSRLPVGIPMQFPDIIDDHQPPPALPPKKNRQHKALANSSQQYQLPSLPPNQAPPLCRPTSFELHTNRERLIPIVRESDGTTVIPQGPSPHPPNVVPPSSLGHSKRFSSESAASSSNASVTSGNSDHHVPQNHHQNHNHHHHHHNHHHSHPSNHPHQLLNSLNQNHHHPPPKEHPQNGSITSGCSDRDRLEDGTSSSKNPSQTSSLDHANHTANTSASSSQLVLPEISDDSPLNKLGIQKWESLIYVNNSEGILELRAGDVDELIILATESTNRDFVYQDAFLLTYRTFISSLALLWKLEYRFRKFNPSTDSVHLKAARSSFSLMVRVVDSLIDCDFQEVDVIKNLSDFIAELVSHGELILARALRIKFIQKYDERRARLLPDLDFGKLTISDKPLNLLQFKSVDLAEQITLMDAQHFWKLEPGELLLWVKEQNEEKSPNLVKFTKHFNAMSFWCRTKILQESDPKERERLIMKFIKVMKFLRKHNNFNSYLAFLSALDSASIRRLEWSKQIVDTIKEYSAIIDFTGSFKAYREALSHAKPPVIPYMGLVLQDLTFVHIGNSDFVKGKVNFAKRWQQYNILDNTRRFKRESYPFQRKEDIVKYFDNFEHALSENDLWEMSERIKPRPRTSPVKLDPLITSSDTPTGNNGPLTKGNPTT